MGGFDDLAAQFDATSTKRKGDQFEVVCKWFLENDPTYQPLLKRVWLWDDWPGRKGIDAGIDLVAEDHDGKLWAIQSKAYDPAYSISKKDVDKFISESSRSHFTHRLLIGTTDKRHHLAAGLMDDLGIPFIGLAQLRKADDDLDWPSSLTDLRPSKPLKPKKPHDYQQAAIRDVVNGFKTADRGQLIMACGTGKTLTAWFITEKLAAERTLVLVPSLSLLKQTMREWQTANPKKPFATLPVCSDETVGSLGEDAAVSHTSDLGVPVTTDPMEIAEFLRKRSGPRVVFSTYQSSPQIAKAFTEGRVPGFDLVIADEAHRVAGPVSSDFGTVLDPAAIKAKRRLFMTATPRYFTGRVLKAAKEADYEVASMDDAAKFGGVFHRLTFSEAIDRKLLTDYQVAIIGVDDATYRDWADRGALVTLDGKKNTDARSLAGQIGLAKAMKKFDLRRVISFHSRVKASRDFAASMPAVLDWMPARQRPKGTLWSAYASGEMSAGERSVLIGHLKRLDDGERGLLANARCLAEGVDVPALDGVAFIDPRRSEVDIVQAVGRAIRKSDNKTVGTIVIPVFIDTDEDAEVALDSSAFKPVWDVIKALRAHDTELGEQLDELRREIGRKGGTPRLPGRIHVDVPASVGTDFIDAFDVHLVDATTAPWEFWYGLLEKYVEEHGTSQILTNAVVDGYTLGSWVATQRGFHTKGMLSEDRKLRLEQFPDWSWNVINDKREAGFAVMQAYVDRYGSATVEKGLVFEGYPLGNWVTEQRSLYTEGKLDDARQRRLEALPGWVWDLREYRWDEGVDHLRAFVAEHGHSLVPTNHQCSDGFRLGQWVVNKRARALSGHLAEERKRELDSMPGWVWNTRDAAWDEGFSHVEHHLKRHGNLRLTRDFRSEDGFRLWQWIVVQRSLHKKGQLSENRKLRLESLPGWTWAVFGDVWDSTFQLLADYAAEHGTCQVPHKFEVDGVAVWSWIGTQRAKYAKGKLSPERQQRLESLDGWSWDPQTDKWEQTFREIAKHSAEQGSCDFPVGFSVDGVNAAGWMRKQRSTYIEGKLGEDRIRRLEALPGWSWSPKFEIEWEKKFTILQEYVAEYGDAKVPYSCEYHGVKLGIWVSEQRGAFGKGKLNLERQLRLEAVPGWVWRVT